MPVPINFRKSAEGMVASYSWSDIGSGTGYVTFYGFDDEDNKAIISSTIDSAVGWTRNDYDAGAAAKRFEDNFDLLFNLPQHVKGKLYVSLTMTAYATTSNEVWGYVTIYHVNAAGAETAVPIGAQQETVHLNNPAGPDALSIRTTQGFTIDKHFKKGESLRVSIDIWGNGANGCYAKLWHDAGNRDFTLVDLGGFACKSNLQICVPFRIDL